MVPGNSTNKSGGNGTGISVALGLLTVISAFYYFNTRPASGKIDPVGGAMMAKEGVKKS